MSSPVSCLYEFGPYRLDLEERTFSRAGQVLALPPKTLDLLALLVRKPGHAFSKQELMSALWPDTFVEEANLSFQISTLRKALGNGAARWIETVPKHGYRFSQDVRGTIPDRSMVGAPHHRSGEHSTASLRADAGFAWPVLPTEAINPVSVALDNASVSTILEMMANEDRRVVAAVHQERERIAQGVEIITQALRTGGRLILVGAGTSGRLGALEAAEMPPTFGTSPHVVQAIVPGGQEEVFRYRGQSESEDRYEDGVRNIARLRVSKTDVVVGISASGTTPFVRGALTRTRKTGAKMILVTCWAGSDLQTFVDVMIAPAVGPEIIAGSTRLKAGTATKMVLNMLTTASMVRLGKTYGNLMVDAQTRSDKLKDRARRTFIIVTGLDFDQADELLRRAHWNVKVAIVMQKLSLSYVDAVDRLKNSQGSIREATGEDIEHRLRELLGMSP